MARYSDLTFADGQIVLEKYSQGNPNFEALLGFFKGNWSAGTSYEVNDMVRSADEDHIWICTTAHVAGVTFDATKFGILLGLAPFQAIVDEIVERHDELDASVVAAASATTTLEGKIAEAGDAGSALATTVLDLVLDQFSETVVVRPLLLDGTDATDAGEFLFLVDKEGWDAPRSVNANLLIDALTDIIVGGTMEEPTDDGLPYMRKRDEDQPTGVYLEAKLVNLTDVSAGTPTVGQALVWDATNSVWVAGTIGGGADALAELSDVDDSLAPDDGDVLVWDTDKFVAQPPSATAPQTTLPISDNSPISADHTFEIADSGHINFVDVTTDINIYFDEDVTTPADEVLVAYFRGTTFGVGKKIRFLPAAGGAGSVPVQATEGDDSKGTGNTNDPLNQEDGDQFNFTHPGGTDCALAVFLTSNPAIAGTAVVSDKIEIGGTDYDWTAKAESVLSNVPKIACRIHPLGTIAETIYSIQPKYLPNGAGAEAAYSNVNSYKCIVLSLTGVHQTTPVDLEDIVASQTATGVTSKGISVNANGNNKLALFGVCMRGGNATTIDIAGTGVTEIVAESAVNTVNNMGDIHTCVAKKNAANGANAATATFPVARPFAELHLCVNPVSAGAAVTIVPPGTDTVAEVGVPKTIGVLYDGNSTPVKVYLDY